MQRRRFLGMTARSAAGLLAGSGAAGAAYGFGYEPSALVVERVDVPLRGLPRDFDGFTIAVLTDLHVGPYTGKAFIDKAAALAMESRPDLCLLGGDYVHRGARYFAPCAEAVSVLSAPHGVFGVTGNHDHWDGVDEAMRQFSGSGVAFLRNQAVTLEKGASHLWLAGVDDLWGRTADPLQATARIPRGDFTLLLAHNPDLVELLPPSVSVNLQVSGHTHGGQVRLPVLGSPIVPSRFGQRFVAGIARARRSGGKETVVYTSRGIGTISPPVRLNCPPEVSLLKLVAA